ncbi:universal stress protein [Eudoraea sp.]|uniref:universal stress protein n=1 Tax=Eudoraea sp. TaxID=1979955 RepID=UPI003C76EE0E
MIRIVLPTDFSKNAWHAIKYATFLFEQSPCTFSIIHAHQVSPSGLISAMNKEHDTRLHEITIKESERILNKIVKHLNRINKVQGHKFEGVMVADSLLNAIGREVIDKDADYIIMGTQGASGLSEIFLGSNTVSVIKNINFCPIIAVPDSYNFSAFNEILFAANFKHLYQQVELQPLLDLAKLRKAKINVIHINVEEELDEEQLQLKKLLRNLLGEKNTVFEEFDYHPNIALKINDVTEKKNAGLIAMLNSQHSFFKGLTREPVVKKVAFKSKIPFLVLPEVE